MFFEKRHKSSPLNFTQYALFPHIIEVIMLSQIKAKFHYPSWFGASCELSSVMEFGFYCDVTFPYVLRTDDAWSGFVSDPYTSDDIRCSGYEMITRSRKMSYCW